MSIHPQVPYRVLLVDDVPEVREALRWALETESDLVVVGEAGTGADALTCAMSLTPDIVILDIELPALSFYHHTFVKDAPRLKRACGPSIFLARNLSIVRGVSANHSLYYAAAVACSQRSAHITIPYRG